MFTKRSRYYGMATVICRDRSGREVRALKLRRLPSTPGGPALVIDSDKLDVMSERLYRDPTRFWHIGDANTELEVNRLVETAGRLIEVPED